jgi:LmbE family N-acetylglucosaminyl deacetylase
MAPWSERSAERFLNALSHGQPRLATRIAIVVAHPDDETIGFGGHLVRCPEVSIVHVTDGAPADMKDARASGFASRRDYAAARRAELRRAMALAGVPKERLLAINLTDQTAAFFLPETARRLARHFIALRVEVVLTHPFEGGHPDHDATCLAARAACGLTAAAGVSPPAIVEMAFYHLAKDGRLAAQCFPDSGRGERCFALDPRAWACKREMLAAFATQSAVLADFRLPIEALRPAPRYDFARLPNEGRLYYERFPWGMTGARWQDHATCALRELGLPLLL